VGRLAVRAVAAGAGHPAIVDRVCERLQRLIALASMTVGADLRLRGGPEHGIRAAVARVAIGAGDVVQVMRASVPPEAEVGGMTAGAHGVLHRDRRGLTGTEAHHRRAFLAAPDPRRMASARTVAGLALQLALAERPARVRRYRVRAGEQRKRPRIVVTAEARVSAVPAVGHAL